MFPTSIMRATRRAHVLDPGRLASQRSTRLRTLSFQTLRANPSHLKTCDRDHNTARGTRVSKRTWDWKEEQHVRKNAEGGRGEKKQTARCVLVCPASEFKHLDAMANRRGESNACSTLESRKAVNRCQASRDMCFTLNESAAYEAPRSPIINRTRVAQHVRLPIHSLQAPLPHCITRDTLASGSSPNMRPKVPENNRSLGKECPSRNMSVSCALHYGSDHTLKRQQRLPTNSEFRIALSAMTLLTPLSPRKQF